MTLGPVWGSETLPCPTSPSLPHSPPHPILHSSPVEALGGWDGAPEPLAWLCPCPSCRQPCPRPPPAPPPQGSDASRSSPCRAWVLLSCPWGVSSCGHPVGCLRTDPQLEEAGRSLLGPHLRLPGVTPRSGPSARLLRRLALSAGAASAPASGAVAQQTGAQVTSSEAAPGT